MANTEGPLAQVTVGGLTYPVVVPHHQTDYIQGNLMRTSTPYEPAMLAAMASAVQRDDLVLDIGANIGNHTLYLAHVAGCRVMAFEPNQELAQALEASVRAGDLEGRVTVRAQALGRAAHRGRLDHLDESNLGGFQVTVDDDGGVEIAVLDDIDLGQRVAAMKIDVEGMELDVLAGAERLVARDRPLLYVEAMDGPGFDRLADWMLAHDYCYQATYNATPTHAFRPARPDERDLNRTLMRVVRESYDLREAEVAMRAARDEAAVRARMLERQLEAQGDLASARLARQQARHEKRLGRARAVAARRGRELEALRRRKTVRAMNALGRLLRRGPSA